MSDGTPEAARTPFGRFYAGPLLLVEQGLVVVCLTLVLGLATLELVLRNLGSEWLDLTSTQIITYYLAFHLGLYSAVLACRSVRHISIDALSPLLPTEVKRWVRAALFAVSAATSVALAVLAWQYIQELPEAQSIIPARMGPFWSERLWKMPMVVAFGLMALHFAVLVAREARGEATGMEYEAPQEAAEDTGEREGGSE